MALECRVVSSIDEVDAAAWDACAGGHPFVQHAFLKALETSGALGLERGVVPRHVLLQDSTHGLVACAPAMLKWGNKREFGPEIRWLKAGIDAGCFAWPKFQVGVPFFPIMGPKLLVRSELDRAHLEAALLSALLQLSSRPDDRGVFNVMHIDAKLAARCEAAEAVLSCEWHAMWSNPGYVTYEDFLAALPGRKRYQVNKERRRASAHGLTFRVVGAPDMTDKMLADYYEGHRRVCARHGGRPWLPLQTYQAIVEHIAPSVLLMGYFEGERLMAGSLKLQHDRVLYALQWSEMTPLPAVALDLICHRPIEFAIRNGLTRLDSGLDAQHKRHRNWQSVPVYHAHWFGNEALKDAANSVLEQSRHSHRANRTEHA